MARDLNNTQGIIYSNPPKVVRNDLDIETTSLQSIVVCPSVQLMQYGKVSNVWYDQSARCWVDFIYCVNYSAPSLLGPAFFEHSSLGLNHFWGLGTDIEELLLTLS